MSNKKESTQSNPKEETMDLSLGAYCQLPSVDEENTNENKPRFIFEINELKSFSEKEFLERVEKVLPTLHEPDIILRTIGKYYEIHFPSRKESMLRLFQHIISNHALFQHSLSKG